MNITAYIEECEREQHEVETEEVRTKRLRAAKTQASRNTYVREVLPSGCVLYKMPVRQARSSYFSSSSGW
jgi:CRISPR/Cas system CMR subunit Cmr4 (Cas7 group RAMP superfamily)